MVTHVSDTNVATNAAISVTKLALGGTNSVLRSDGYTNSFSASPTVTSLTTTSHLATSVSPALSGVIRMAHGQSVKALNLAGDTDIAIIDWGETTSNEVWFGGNAGGQSTNAYLRSSTNVSLNIGGTNRLSTSASALSLAVPLVEIAAAQANPVIQQENIAAGPGQDFSIKAQSATSSGAGGKLILASGTGPGGTANVEIATGTITRLTFSPAGGLTVASNIISWDGTAVTVPTLKHNNKLSGNASTLVVQAQNANAGTGGDLSLTSGTGTVEDGYLRLQVGGSNAVVIGEVAAADLASAVGGEVLTLESGIARWKTSGVPVGGANEVYWSNGVVNSWTGSPIISTYIGVGTGTLADAGNIRLPNNTSIAWRNAGDTADLGLTLDTSNILQVGATGGIRFGNAVTAVSTLGVTWSGEAVQLANTYISLSGTSDKLIRNATVATASVTGAALEINSTDCSGNTATVGGQLTVRAGDATGAGGTHTGGEAIFRAGNASGASGTRTGGKLTLSSGTGVTADGDVEITRGTENVLLATNSAITLGSGGGSGTMFELVTLGTRRIVALAAGADLTTTEMPANTGDRVVYIADAAVAPTADGYAGGIMYSEGGAGKWRGSSGTTSTFGPAEPHCPDCGRDFALEWTNNKYGALTLCMWCFSIGATQGVIKREPK